MAIFDFASLEHQNTELLTMANSAQMKHALVVFDSAVEDQETLASGLPHGISILRLRTSSAPLEAIADALEAAVESYAALHLVSHGRPGALQLSGLTLSAAAAAQHALVLSRIGNALVPDACITLTACEVAQGAADAALLDTLEAMTNRQVIGTASIVGGSDPGSFAFSGLAMAAPLFSLESRSSYSARLALTPVDLTDTSDDGTVRDDNVTSITAPTISFTADFGHVLEIDWDDGNGFVATGVDTGSLQTATAPADYGSDGAKTVTVRANGSVTESLTITIDTTPAIIDVFTNTDNLAPGLGLGFSGISSINVSGTAFLFTVTPNDSPVSTLRSYEVSSTGTLTLADTVSDDATLQLSGASSIAAANVGGTAYIFTGSVGGGDDISVFSVAANGTLTNTDNVSDDGTLHLLGVTSLNTVIIGDNVFLVSTGAADDGISVFSVANDGTRLLDGAWFSANATVDGTAYLYVGGDSDDGITIFSMDANGQLTDVGTVVSYGRKLVTA